MSHIGAREERMRKYEAAWKFSLPAKEYVVIRLDGRAFHTFTKGMDRPFDQRFMGAMDFTAIKLCSEIQGARFAYVQSDEISVLITNFGFKEQRWFGGDVQKTLSISAGIASASMSLNAGRPAMFDSRILVLPDEMEVVSYFLWRQADAVRNAIQMTAQCVASQKKLANKDRHQQLEIIKATGIDYEASVPPGFRNGRVVVPFTEPMTHTFTHKKTGEISTIEIERTSWRAEAAPFFDWDQAGFLNTNIPKKKEN